MRRPSSIVRPSGFSGVSDSGDNISCNSSVITRPSLLTDIRLDMSQRMQAPWKVNDASLRPVPPFYPPLCPTCTVIITDAPPSVVASRISECLTKRSISVEYDEETVSDVKVSGPVSVTSAHSWHQKLTWWLSPFSCKYSKLLLASLSIESTLESTCSAEDGQHYLLLHILKRWTHLRTCPKRSLSKS